MDIVQLDSSIAEYEGRMSGYVAHYYYQMADIAVKVNPNAFLSTTVNVDGSNQNLEDVCKPYQTDDYTASLVPLDPKYIIPMIKAFKTTHPEFGLDESSYTEENGTERRYLICTMAEVNDDRYDIYTKAIDTRFKEVMSKLKELSKRIKATVGSGLVGASAEAIKSFDDRISHIEENSYKSCQITHDDKLVEVNEGHEIYLARIEQEKQEQAEQEQSRAASMKMDI